MYESSVADAVSHFTAHGYTGGFRAENGELRDVITGLTYRPEQLRIDDLVRFEGESDPGDSAAVFALSEIPRVESGEPRSPAASGRKDSRSANSSSSSAGPQMLRSLVWASCDVPYRSWDHWRP